MGDIVYLNVDLRRVSPGPKGPGLHRVKVSRRTGKGPGLHRVEVSRRTGEGPGLHIPRVKIVISY
jgi:hypothetical protein